MIPIVTHHEVVTPAKLEDALAFLKEHAGEAWQPLAGGTDLMVYLNYGRATPTRWLDLSRLRKSLSAITRENGLVRIGGLATMTELSRSTICAQACPMIGEAARTVGAVQIQNRATVAGNIVNASPAGDTLPVWLALEAEIELASQGGVRRVPYGEFTTGYRTTVRRDDELLTAVLFEPMKPGTRYLFRKVGTRAAQAISKVVLAALSRTGGGGAYGEVRLAFGSMAPVPKRASEAEHTATGQLASIELGRIAASRISTDLSPIDDVRSNASYRMSVGRNLVREFLAGRLGAEHRA